MKRWSILVICAALATEGCAAVQSLARKPGRVSKTSDGWVLQGMRVPTGEHVVTVDVFQPRGKTQLARFAITAYEPDTKLACEDVRFRHGGQETPLQNVNRVPFKTGESVQGDIDIARLGRVARSADTKLEWCSMAVVFDAEALARLREYAEMAGGG